MTADTESLDQLFKTYKVKWYRCPIEQSTLYDLMRARDLQGWFQTLGHLLVFGGTGALSYYFFDRELWVGFALALFAHGTVASHFHYGCHELEHGTVFRTKWLNAFFLRVYSVLAWWNFHEHAISHTYHHIYTLHPRADKEVTLPANPSLRPHYLLQLFGLNLFGGFATRGVVTWLWGTVKTSFGAYGVFSTPGWLEALYENRPDVRKRAVNWARFLLLFHVGFAILAIALGYWIVAVLLSIAPFIANWLAYFVGVPMHCGLRDDVPDFRLCARSITLDPISEFLYWHMNWHLEHHMFAAIPCYNLKRLHHAVARDMPPPRTLFGSWREMRQAWDKQKQDQAYQFDTPLPPPSAGASAQDPEAASIGDIAPVELR